MKSKQELIKMGINSENIQAIRDRYYRELKTEVLEAQQRQCR